MEAQTQRAVERATGHTPRAWRGAHGGYTPAKRWITSLDNGDSVFVKVATDKDTARWLRTEHRFYSAVNTDFMADMLGWDDEGEHPVLILEDLSEAVWTSEWTPARVEAVQNTLAAVAATRPPDFLPPMDKVWPSAFGWKEVARDPTHFLSLGIGSKGWLESILPALIEAEDALDLSGQALAHFDVRSDNICFVEGRAVMVDWNFACRGNAQIDVAAWLPSLHAEGGPAPETVLPDAQNEAAAVSGYFASQAGRPILPHAPRVRIVQKQQLDTALPWALRALGLSKPG